MPGKILRAWLERLVENPLLRRVIKNSAYLFSATGFAVAASFFQNLLVTRLLGVYYLGLLGGIIKFTSVLNKLFSFRMNELVIRYVGMYSEQKDSQRAAAVFKAACLVEGTTSLLAYGAVFLLAPLGARYFAKDLATTEWFVLYGLVVIANLVLESATGLLHALNRFKRHAVLSILESTVTLVVISWAFFTRGGLLEVLLAYMAGKAVFSVGITLQAFTEGTRAWGGGWWRAPLSLLQGQGREMAHFAISTNISATINLVNKDSEELWVLFFRGPIENGYYKQALALSNLVLLPIAPLPQATYPELTREVSKKNWQNVRYILLQGSRVAALYTVPVVIGLVFFGQPLIEFLYTAAFLPAYPALVVLLVGFLAANVFYWNRTALLALDKPGYPTRVNLVAAILKVGLALVLLPMFGYVASAALLSGYYIFSVGLNARKAFQTLHERETALAQPEEAAGKAS